MVWNERVSRGKEMSTSLATEYNRHEYHREKKEKKCFFVNLLVKVFHDVGVLSFVIETSNTRTPPNGKFSV